MNIPRIAITLLLSIYLMYGFSQADSLLIETKSDSLFVEQKNNQICESDSVVSSKVAYFKFRQIVSPFYQYPSYIDTTLTGFQIYDFANKNDRLFFASKGNIGHSTMNLVFNPISDDLFPLFFENHHYGYINSISDLNFYKPNHVSSELYYVFGSSREQLFYAKHAQKANDNLYFGFAYNVISSPGRYSRLNARNNSLYGLVDYTTTNKKYQLISTATYGKIMNHESGGLEDRLAFEDDDVRESVILSQAQYKHYDFEITLNHYYKLGFDINDRGTSEKTDSVYGKDKKAHFNLGRIGHEAVLKRKSFVFEDKSAVSSFFDKEPFNVNQTYDSTVVMFAQNELSWSNYPQQGDLLYLPVNFKLYLKHQYIELKFPNLSAPRVEDGKAIYFFNKWHFNQYIPGIEVQSDNTKYISLKGKAEYTMLGYNDSDMLITAGLGVGRDVDKHKVLINASYSEKAAPYFYHYYIGNYQNWGTKFDKIKMTNASVRYLFNGIELGGDYFIINNMVFMNESLEPTQNQSTLNTYNLSIKTDHKFYGIGLKNYIVYQYVPNESFIDYPKLMSYNSLYYENKLFKKVMDFQLGFDFYYNSSYHPSAFMPVVMQFYKQQDFKSPDLYLLDVFLNVKISDVRVFLKYQNILGLIMDTPVNYQIPFYPFPESMFKFGISWLFFD
ncbi:MAG: hypothetical protein KGZ97_01825 [Bacteroidetes bacterium]|nr:hypothetical protein [Bacteroidota bacterium]